MAISRVRGAAIRRAIPMPMDAALDFLLEAIPKSHVAVDAGL
jgi:hypothetical protein